MKTGYIGFSSLDISIKDLLGAQSPPIVQKNVCDSYRVHNPLIAARLNELSLDAESIVFSEVWPHTESDWFGGHYYMGVVVSGEWKLGWIRGGAQMETILRPGDIYVIDPHKIHWREPLTKIGTHTVVCLEFEVQAENLSAQKQAILNFLK